MTRLWRHLSIVLDMIKFQHTVFALPFAFIGALLAARGWPSLGKVFWILLACVFARSAAMSFNRVADESFDRLNPRTQGWALPQGLLTRRFVIVFSLVNCAGFVFAASRLNGLALALSPVALIVLLGYSLTKRFTSFSHYFLGGALGLAPIGAWIAVRGDVALVPILLGLAVLFWTAGFDIIYSCQDYEFDLNQPLFSIPKTLGVGRALQVSTLTHIVAFVLLAVVWRLSALGIWTLAGVLAAGALLAYEHSLVRPNDLSRVNAAFFTVNGFISILLFVAVALDLTLRSSQ